MELWVRSQDKLKLVKVNYVYIMESNDHFTIYGETIDSGPIIATYKTKERALKVLDEIQNILKPKTIVLKDLNKLNEEEINQLKNVLSIIPPVNSIQELPTYVYEMPEEWFYDIFKVVFNSIDINMFITFVI